MFSFRASRQNSDSSGHIWPAFVDVLSTLLVVLIFVIFIFSLSQLSQLQEIQKLIFKNTNLEQLVEDSEAERHALFQDLSSSQTREERLLVLQNQLEQNLKLSEEEKKELRQRFEQLRQSNANLDTELTALKNSMQAISQRLNLLPFLEDTEPFNFLGEGHASLDRQLTRLLESSQALVERSAQLEKELEDSNRSQEQQQLELNQQLAQVALLENIRNELEKEVAHLQDQLGAQELPDSLQDADTPQEQIMLLNSQLFLLRRKLEDIQTALKIEAPNFVLNNSDLLNFDDLSETINLDLLNRVQELDRIKSSFLETFQSYFTSRSDFTLDNDSFTFQSEIFFDLGSADVKEQGRDVLQELALVLKELSEQLPQEQSWVLQIEGHTDNIPLRPNSRFRSNWHLASERALSVLEELVALGAPVEHLSAASFGEFSPISSNSSPQDLQKNRRIEFKIMQK